MYDFTEAFIRIGLLEDPNPLAPYYGKSLAELPKVVLEKILTETSPGDPESLRLTSSEFNSLYLDHEADLPIRKQPGTSMVLSHDEAGLKVRISGRAKGHNYDFELMNPSTKQLTKFFRVAGEVTFSTFTAWPLIFQGQFPRMPWKTLLAKQDFTAVNLKTYDPIITRCVLELFEDTSKLKWFTNEEEAREIDVDDLERIQYMTSTDQISNETLSRVLDNHRTLQNIRLTIDSDFDHYKYVEEWYLGTRRLTKWEFEYPNLDYYEIAKCYNKDECDCTFVCVGENHDSIYTMYLMVSPCK